MKANPQVFAHCLVAASLMTSCVGVPPQFTEKDNDDFDIPEPAYDDRGDYVWSDGAYMMSVYQFRKLLDVGWVLRKSSILAPKEADNVNAIDEVPDSTWFTNRHGSRRMSEKKLVAGPRTQAPAGTWRIYSGKSIGSSPGFLARDQRGTNLFVKFDPPDKPGLGSNGDVIVSRFMHAIGFNTAQYRLVAINEANLVLSPEAILRGRYNVERKMTRADLDAILRKAPRDSQGNILANVSFGIPGAVKGPFSYLGTRRDDPNDTVRHEDRRELRGLHVIMSWFNNTDSRGGNTLDTFVEEDGRGYLKHYLLDFSESFGAIDGGSKDATHGHVYRIDPQYVANAWGSLGIPVNAIERATTPAYAGIGYFDAMAFDPDRWRGDYANPAFERATTRDKFWAAKIITAFSDTDIAAIVATGYFESEQARDYLTRVLIARRNIIGRTYFDIERINPLDRFKVRAHRDHEILDFVDLAVDRGYEDAATTSYRYRIDHAQVRYTTVPTIPVLTGDSHTIVRIETSRGGDRWSHPVAVSLLRQDGKTSVTGVQR